MAARDHQSIEIACPKCGAVGRVHFSDNDYPCMRRNDRSIDGIEGDFKASLTAKEQFRLSCGECKHSFEK